MAIASEADRIKLIIQAVESLAETIAQRNDTNSAEDLALLSRIRDKLKLDLENASTT